MNRVVPQNTILSEKEIFGGSLKDFKILCELGRGSFGTVYKAESLLNNRECVLKKIDINSLKEKHRKNAIKEVEILKKVRHENIIKYYNSFLEDNALYIVMEYAAGGDLQKQINVKKNQKQSFSEDQIWDYAFQIAQALIYLHSHKIIHRDIKALNIFLDKNNKIKLGDLGVSKIVANQIAINGTRVGTPLYLAPELVKHQPYDNKIDIWAFGCVVYYLACLEPPFSGENLISLGYNIVNRFPKNLPIAYSETLSNFIMALLEKNNEKRKSLVEILEFFPNSKKKTEKTEEKKQIAPVQQLKTNTEIKSPVNLELKKEIDFVSYDDFKKIQENKKTLENTVKTPLISSVDIPHEKPQYKNEQVMNNMPSPPEKEQKIDNFITKTEKNETPIIEKQEEKQQKDLEKEKPAQKFKIRPCSANVKLSNKVKELPTEKNQIITPNSNLNDQIKNKINKINDPPPKVSPENVPPKQKQKNPILFRPKSAIVAKSNPLKNQSILSSRIVNNFVKEDNNENKKESKEPILALLSDDHRKLQEKNQPKETFAKVCPEIKDVLAFPTQNLHSCFYENKNNNLNSNFFFQIFGVPKPGIEKTAKFQINNISDNSTLLIAANTIKKKEEFSETTQRTVQPKICVKKRDETLNRKAISSLNFFQQCSKPSGVQKEENKIEKSGQEKILNNLLFQNKVKRKLCIKDLMDD